MGCSCQPRCSTCGGNKLSGDPVGSVGEQGPEGPREYSIVDCVGHRVTPYPIRLRAKPVVGGTVKYPVYTTLSGVGDVTDVVDDKVVVRDEPTLPAIYKMVGEVHEFLIDLATSDNTADKRAAVQLGIDHQQAMTGLTGAMLCPGDRLQFCRTLADVFRMLNTVDTVKVQIQARKEVEQKVAAE